jgi:hypothetical protein
MALHDIDWSEYSSHRPRRFQVWRMRRGQPTIHLGAFEDVAEASGLARPSKPALVFEEGVPVLRVPARGPESGPLAKPGTKARRRADRKKLREAVDGTKVRELGLTARRARQVADGLEGLRLERAGRWVVVRTVP